MGRLNRRAAFRPSSLALSAGETVSSPSRNWTAFAPAPNNEFRFGNSGRNILTGPGMVSVDFSVFKRFATPWERHHLEFRAEFFNLPNRANFGQPVAAKLKVVK